MKQLIATLTAVQLSLLLLTGANLGQEPGVADQSDDLEITVTASDGAAPADWDAETLTKRIRDGSVRIENVRPPGEDVFPTKDIVVAAQMILAGSTIKPEWLVMRPVPIDDTNAYALTETAEATGWIAAVDIFPYQPVSPNLLWAEASDPQVDRPQPVEVVDAGLSASGGGVNYAVVVRNPNASRWSASLMPVQIDVLDKEGVSVATEMEYITLLPRQTGAVVGVIAGAKGAVTLDVTIADGFRYWITYDYVTGDLDFADVKTKGGSDGPRTTGTIESLFEDPKEGVQVMAVYRDKDGDILGGDFTFLRMLPVARVIPFTIDGVTSISPRKVASTEVYYEQ